MSVKIMGRVWELDLPANKLLVMLALADHADHDGNNVYPSMELIAWKTGYSTKQTRRIVHDLVEDGLLVVKQLSKGRYPSKYSIDLTAGKQKPPRPDKPSQSVRVKTPDKPSQIVQVNPSQDGRVAHSQTLPQTTSTLPNGDQPGHSEPVNPPMAVSTEPYLEPSQEEPSQGTQTPTPGPLKPAAGAAGVAAPENGRDPGKIEPEENGVPPPDLPPNVQKIPDLAVKRAYELVEQYSAAAVDAAAVRTLAAKNVENPAGFMISLLEKGEIETVGDVEVAGRPDDPDGSRYVTGKYADYLEH